MGDLNTKLFEMIEIGAAYSELSFNDNLFRRSVKHSKPLNDGLNPYILQKLSGFPLFGDW